MKKIIAITFFSLTFYSGFAQNSNSELERFFKKNIVKELGSVGLSEQGLFRVSSFLLNYEYNKVILYDYSTHNLYEMVLSDLKNPEVLEINEIGNGKGSGPGEFRNPTALCIAKHLNQSYIILGDPELSRVTIWHLDTKYIINSFNPRISPFRMGCNNNIISLYNTSNSKGGSIGIYNFEGKSLGIVDDINQSAHRGDGFVNSGNITQNESAVFYAGEGNLTLSKVGISQQAILNTNMIVDSREFKNDVNVEKLDKNTIKIKRGDNFVYFSRDIGIIDQYLIVLHSGRTSAYGKFLDFYDSLDLSYRFSVELPESTQYMSVTDNVITIKRYESETQKTYLKFYEIDTTQF